jgi:TonB family protein
VIYDVTRGTHRRVEFDDLLTASDVEWLRFGAFAEVTVRIRTMPNTGSQVLTVSFPAAEGWQGPVETDVDLGTAARLQPVLDVYPAVREIIAEASAERASNEGCEEGTAAETIDSDELLARATHEPLPGYPELAFRAGVAGTVVVEVVVGEDGAVSCVRVLKGLPFGLDAAAVKAIRQWRFSTDDDSGRKAPFTGVLQVRFQINTPKTS